MLDMTIGVELWGLRSFGKPQDDNNIDIAVLVKPSCKKAEGNIF